MAKTNERVVETLIEGGITHAFTLPGLGITWSLPAFKAQEDKLKVVLTRSEWIASIMAQVTGKLTGRPAVAMGQGPWMTTIGAIGILEAHFSGSPMVVLTETSDYDGYGQMGVYQTMTGDYGGADAMASLRPITKYCTYATAPAEAVYGVQMAIKHASLPRMGPAAVVMKTPIIRAEMPDPPSPRLYPTRGYQSYTPARPGWRCDHPACRECWRSAKRPVIVAGNGVVMTQSGAALQKLAEAAGIAVVTSYNGKGVIAETSPVAAGMLGTWGHACANRTLAAADTIVVLGASLGPDYTRFRDPKLIRPGEQRIVQVDIDPRNAGWVYPVDLAITGDVVDVLAMLDGRDLGAAQRSGTARPYRGAAAADRLPQAAGHHVRSGQRPSRRYHPRAAVFHRRRRSDRARCRRQPHLGDLRSAQPVSPAVPRRGRDRRDGLGTAGGGGRQARAAEKARHLPRGRRRVHDDDASHHDGRAAEPRRRLPRQQQRRPRHGT